MAEDTEVITGITYEENSNRNIIFIDPNQDKGEVDLFNSPEDYCISVDLDVEIPGRTTQSDGKKYSLSWKSKRSDVPTNEFGKTSFMKGSLVGGKNVLTDFYTTNNYSDEAIGISSIDITYDSWYLPQIAIKFVDVRGGALFNAAQYQEDTKNESSNNLFRAFFSFPYPLFRLQIKGFYGDAVTYELLLIDFRGSFNSQTGNFEVNTKFVGNTYAFLADIRFNLLRSAPYNKSYGVKYWENNVANSRFHVDGQAMPTLMDLNRNIEAVRGEITKLMAEDDDVKRYTRVQSNQNKILNIMTLWNIYERLLSSAVGTAETNHSTYINDTANKKIKFILGSKDEKIETSEVINAKNDLVSAITEFNNENLVNNIAIIYPNSGSQAGFNILISPIDTPEDGNYTDEYIKNNINLVDGSVKYLYTINYSEFDYNIIDLNTNNKKDFEESRNLIAEKIKSFTQQAINFKPSINNISKIIFAHLETFMATYYSCLDNINASNRMVGQYFTDMENTDVNGLDTTNVNLPPFPYTTDKGEEIWAGQVRSFASNEQLEEVKYVESIIDAVATTEKMQAEVINLTSRLQKEFWYPINPYDTYFTNHRHYNNPYNDIKNDDFYNLVYQIGIRMFSSLTNYTNRTNVKDIEAMYKIIAKAEANNVYKAFEGNSKILDNFKVSNINKNIINMYLGNNEGGTHRNYEMTSLQLPDGASKTNKYGSTSLMRKLPNEHLYDKNYEYSFIGSGDVLPLYAASVDEYGKDWYCGTKMSLDFNKNIPFVGRSNSIRDDNFNIKGYLTSNKEYNSFIFNINNNLENYISLQQQVESGDNAVQGLTGTWKLDPEHSIKFIGSDASFIRIPSYDENIEKNSGITYLPQVFSSETTKFNKNEKHELYSTANKSSNTKQLVRDLRVTNNNVVVPFIGHKTDIEKVGGWIAEMEYSSSMTSLFGSILYYSQNDDENKRRTQDYNKIETDDDLKLRIKRSKALLFLSTLPWDKQEVNFYFKNMRYAGIQRFPKSVLLKIGAMLWRHQYKLDNNRLDPIFFDTTYYVKPNNNTYIDNIIVTKKYTNKYNEYDLIAKDFDGIFEQDSASNEQTISKIKLSNNLTKQIIDYFTEWCDAEFPIIRDAFELKSKGGTEILKTTNLLNLCDELNKIKDDNITIQDVYNLIGAQAFNTYCRVYYGKNSGKSGFNKSIYLVNRENSNVMTLVSNLLKDDVCLLNTNYDILNDNHEFKVKQYVVESYVSTFIEELKKLIDGKKSDLNTEEKTSMIVFNNKILKMELYRTLKNLYDKWCAAKKFDYYKLENCYTPNFKYIDKFYNDIGDSLIVNLDTFNEITFDGLQDDEMGSGVSLYSVMSAIVTRHNMLFIPTSTNIKWMQNEEDFKNVFKPISFYNKSKKVNHTGFTGIYVGQPSTVLDVGSVNYGYKDDGLYFKPVSNLPTVRTGVPTYPIPCFAISYAKQNQSYFKNIELTMNNPVDTEQSINAVQNLMQKNSGAGSQKIAQGQDMYSIYTRNSYQANVKMMGCAQIQPMMYFQLFNIPMFKGAYMIYKVNHRITPGNMTTNFTGMRMSKSTPPLESEAFAYKSFLGDIDEVDMWLQSTNYDLNGNNTNYKIMDASGITGSGGIQSNFLYKAVNYTIKDGDYIDYMGTKNSRVSKTLSLEDCVDKVGNYSKEENGKIMPFEVNQNLCTLGSNVDRIAELLAKSYDGKYRLGYSSIWRSKHYPKPTATYTSFHYVGSAIDLRIYESQPNDDVYTMLKNGVTNRKKAPKSIYKDFIYKIKDNNIKYSELLNESTSSGNSYWIHYGYNLNVNKETFRENFIAKG